MSATATCAPASARATAVARPSPLAAPVIRATRPVSAALDPIAVLLFASPSLSRTASTKTAGTAGRRSRESAADRLALRGCAPDELRRCRPHVSEGDGAQLPLCDELQQVVVDGRD